jgi:hypothetical protein
LACGMMRLVADPRLRAAVESISSTLEVGYNQSIFKEDEITSLTHICLAGFIS